LRDRVNPASAQADVTVPSVMTFASGFYTGGCVCCYMGGLFKMSQMCDPYMVDVKAYRSH